MFHFETRNQNISLKGYYIAYCKRKQNFKPKENTARKNSILLKYPTAVKCFLHTKYLVFNIHLLLHSRTTALH